MLAGIGASVLLNVLLVVVAAATAEEVVSGWFLLVIVWGPFVLGIALVAGRSSRPRYAFGVGVLIGWPLGVIASAGLCYGGAVTTPFLDVG